jgi:hypothetical protein
MAPAELTITMWTAVATNTYTTEFEETHWPASYGGKRRDSGDECEQERADNGQQGERRQFPVGLRFAIDGLGRVHEADSRLFF